MKTIERCKVVTPDAGEGRSPVGICDLPLPCPDHSPRNTETEKKWYSYGNNAATPTLRRVAALYDAGRVQRLHCRATVAQHPISTHVYGSLILAVELSALNDVRLEKVLLALLYHDAAELVTGDVPAPVKRENPVLAGELRKLEHEWEGRMELPLPGDLTKPEQMLVKACDTLDLAFNVLHERQMGNRSPWMVRVFHNCFEYLKEQENVVGVNEMMLYLAQSWKEEQVNGGVP